MPLTLTVFSDLHTEFYHDPENDWFFKDLDLGGVDVVVLAGDILLGRNSLRFYERIAALAPHVVAVAGNHEFYHGEFDSVHRRIKSLEIPNFHFLEKESVEINGVKFHGCTLWYNGGPDCVYNEMFMNDFRLIYHKAKGYRNFIYKYAQESKAWLKQTVQPGDVVVTHMLPHEACVDNSYRGDSMNAFYFNNCEKVLEENRPALWLHGHSHNNLDTKIYDTRIVRNPHGYPGERGVGFNKSLRISL
jgi:Icc-related predicted phosphoesterase